VGSLKEEMRNSEDEEDNGSETRAEKIRRQRSNLKELYQLYKRQYKEKTEKEREPARKRNEMIVQLPPKPIRNIADFSTGCKSVLKAVGRSICEGSRFTGAALFENQTTEVALELDITSDRNELGEFSGKRIPFDNVLGVCDGKGRLWCDMIWNEQKQQYQEGVCFRWTDEQQGVMTVFDFNSVCDQLDIKHSFYEGVVMRYPAFIDRNDPELQTVIQYGIFDFLCSSRKSQDRDRMEFGQFGNEWLYGEEIKKDEQKLEEPKFVQRMFDYADKIEEARTKDRRQSLKLQEGDDWASHLFGKRYSIRGSANCKQFAEPLPTLLDNLPRKNSTLRSRKCSLSSPPPSSS